MNRYTGVLICLLLIGSFGIKAQVDGTATTQPNPSFTVVPLGVKGGLDESNLSSYLVARVGTTHYIALDAGTLYSGIRKAIERGVFPGPGSMVLRQYITAYFISHPHLDHVAGLILNSPDDSAKDIYGLPFCLDVLQDKYFSWKSWANFGDEGEKPMLKKYHYVTMVPGNEMAIEKTTLFVTAYPLSHGNPYESTAFLVKSGEACLLYLGDTGPDSVEHSDKLHRLWQVAAPLVRAGELKAIFIEVSFPSEQSDKSLFGHLTPRWLMEEMKDLEQQAGPGSLKGLPVVITHMKPGGDHGDQEVTIRQELTAHNPMQLRLIFPEQGQRLDF